MEKPEKQVGLSSLTFLPSLSCDFMSLWEGYCYTVDSNNLQHF
jgi:hypothetical protein